MRMIFPKFLLKLLRDHLSSISSLLSPHPEPRPTNTKSQKRGVYPTCERPRDKRKTMKKKTALFKIVGAVANTGKQNSQRLLLSFHTPGAACCASSCLLALKNEKETRKTQRNSSPPTLVPPISSLPADDGPENKTLCPPKLRSQDDGVVVRRKNPRENQKHPSTFEFLLHPLASKPYSRVRPCFVDICLPTVDIMGISEQPEKHGGHHGGELIPTLFIDMREDPDCRTTPKKRPYRTLLAPGRLLFFLVCCCCCCC